MSAPTPSTASTHSKPQSHPPKQDSQDPTALSLLQTLQQDKDQAIPASEIYNTQIVRRTLILRGTSPDPNSQSARGTRRAKRLASQARLKSRQRPRKLSAKEKRTLRVYDLELAPGGRKTAASWSVWKGLWRIWCGYVWEVLHDEKQKGPLEMNLAPTSLGPKLASLDLHGALLRVVKANCSSVVGLWGVCVRETKFGVLLVDNQCCVRRVGKKGTVFRLEIPLLPTEKKVEMTTGQEGMNDGDEKGLDLDVFLQGENGRVLFEISGNALLCRPADRATKKFKVRKYDGF